MDNKKYCLKPGYVLREIAGEHLAIPVSTDNNSDMVVLNPASAILWKELETEKTLDELTAVICESFDISKEEASNDIKEFLDSLENAGILK